MLDKQFIFYKHYYSSIYLFICQNTDLCSISQNPDFIIYMNSIIYIILFVLILFNCSIPDLKFFINSISLFCFLNIPDLCLICNLFNPRSLFYVISIPDLRKFVQFQISLFLEILNSRRLFYHNTNVALICFSIADRHSLENVNKKWIPEIQRYCPQAPIVLVGTKLDLRKKEPNNGTTQTGAACLLDLPPGGAACIPDMLIPPSEGKRVADRFKALAYLECSAKDDVGVQTVFETAVTASLNPPIDKDKRCLLV